MAPVTLRRTPADFVVQEVLSPEVLGSLSPDADVGAGRVHAVYELKKTSLSTPEATGLFAGALKMKAGGVSHAGLKDKHAETTQHVSVELPEGKEPSSLPEVVESQRFSARRIGWASAALDASAIACNRFAMVVRGLGPQECREMDARAQKLAAAIGWGEGRAASLPIVNYFGDQRFGSARHGQGFAGRRLIEGDFEGALKLLIGTPARKDTGARRDMTRALIQHWGDWEEALAKCPNSPERAAVERLAAGGSFKEAFASLPHLNQQMAVEAYQSHLWNAVARRLVHELSAGAGLIHVEDEFGAMDFATKGEAVAALRTIQIPMLAPETVLRGPWAKAAREVMAEERVTLEGLKIPGLRRPAFGSAERPALVEASEIWISPWEKDELAPAKSSKPWKKRVEFVLPRGAYATVVMRALGQ